MKNRATTLSLALVVIVALTLAIAGCGSSTTSTTSAAATTLSTAATTSSTEASTTTAASEGSTTSSAGVETTTTAAGGGAGGSPTELAVKLTGDGEVPAVQTDATGTFTLTISMGSATDSSAATSTSGAPRGLLPAGLQVTYKLEVTNIKDATAAHIHLGAAGQNGDVIYPLFTGPQKSGTFTGVLAEGPLSEANLTGPFKGKSFVDLVAVVLSGGTYVNVHTAANPAGELRGQLIINIP